MTTGRINQVATLLSAYARKHLHSCRHVTHAIQAGITHRLQDKLCFSYPSSKGIEKQSVAILIILFFLNDKDEISQPWLYNTTLKSSHLQRSQKMRPESSPNLKPHR
jgi:hypothetical protein